MCHPPFLRGKLRLYRAEWRREEYGAVYYEPFVEC